MTVPAPGGPCPCGLGDPYPACCGRLHAGDRAATAEQLMRSRYCAFAVGDSAHLLRTWHSSTRPARAELDPDRVWTRLEVTGTTGGGFLDVEGTVAFRAHSRRLGRTEVMVEDSRFVRDDDGGGSDWRYVGPA